MHIPTTNLRLTIPLLILCSSASPAAPYRESPLLAARVAAGDLPPVEDRLPEEPLVVKTGSYGVTSIGRYGGVLRRDGLATADMQGATDITVPFYNDLLDEGAFLPLGWKGYEKSADASAWTFFLRRGMKWSDGHPYTVDDVLFWFDDFILHRELTPIPPSWLMHGGALPTLQKIDDHTLCFRFAAPNLNFPRIMSWYAERNFMAFPKHYLKTFHPGYVEPQKLEQRTRKEGFDTWTQLFESKRDMLYQSNAELPTLCPWMVKVGVPNNPTLYVRNPYYYAVDTEGNQLPYIDEVRWTLVGNYDRIKMRMMSGSVSFQRIKELESAELFAQARKKGHIDFGIVEPWENYTGHTAVFNLVTPDPVKQRLFNDKRFRHALSLMMPREEIADLIYSGLVQPKQIGIKDPDHKWYVEELATAFVETDVEEANRLLDGLGLTQRDKAGRRLRPDGKPLQITVHALVEPRYEKAAEIVCEHLPDVGIKANLRIISYDRLSDALREAGWEMFIVGDAMGHTFLWPSGMEGVRASPWNAYPWYEWLSSGGTSGEEPPESMKTSWAWWQKAKVAPSEEALKEAIVWLQRNAADELLAIGLTSFTPQIRIKVPHAKNVPFADPWFLYSAAYFEE